MNHTRRLLFFCGQFGVMVLARFFFQWIVDYSTETPDGATEALFAASAFGGLLLGWRIFDAVTDPIAGIVSDRWSARGGQRRTLLWFSFAFPAIGVAMCFAPTLAMAASTRWAWAVVGMFVFYAGYTFYGIPYWSLVEEYGAEDPAERRRLSNLLGLAMMLATAVGFILTPILIQRFDFFWGAVVCGGAATVLMILPYFAAPPREGSRTAPLQATSGGPLDGMKGALVHRRYMAVLALFGGSQMSLTIMTAMASLFAVDLLAGAKGDVALLLGPMLATSIPSFVIVPWFSRRVGWERALFLASLCLGVVYAMTWYLGSAVVGTPFVTAMLIFGLAGPMVSVLIGLEGEAVTDCAREAGGNSVGAYFGVYNFVVKGLNGLALAAATVLAGAARTPEQAPTLLREMGLVGPAAIKGAGLLAGVCLWIGALVYLAMRPRNAA